ncbi:cytochrome c [Litoribacter ruber]|uniref:Cytochrome c n=1 Tax=Litoribacter ruber TaxID=702568 RepID=A0AAP2CGY2_9BACT|nr:MULTISPECIES: cytochrome c [Litoribacter]MBS9524476.1 cytochrome c [Litoribacter alkaliphilus]MBT0810354.1 cytochrome c [Litoribacter ruber]
MKVLQIPIALMFALFLVACGSSTNETGTRETAATKPAAAKSEVPQTVKEGKGIGQTTHVELAANLDDGMVADGKSIFDMKCSACHKLNDKRVVGPGFEGVTNRRKPEWIMNMITNVDDMLDTDPEAQKLLEECLTRMPNQNVSLEEARNLLEYMRHNDKERTGKMDGAVNN